MEVCQLYTPVALPMVKQITVDVFLAAVGDLQPV